MQPERDDEDQREERFGQDRRAQQKKRGLQKKKWDGQFRAVEFDLPREPECLPRRRKADDDREKFRRRVAELGGDGIEDCEERTRPDADEVLRMAMRPAREKKVITGILLVGVTIEKNQRSDDCGYKSKQD